MPFVIEKSHSSFKEKFYHMTIRPTILVGKKPTRKLAQCRGDEDFVLDE